MKFRYNIKSISNNIFKKIVRNIGYNIDRISDLELKINKIILIKDRVKKYSEVKAIAKKYPKDPRVQLFLAETMYDNWDANYFDQINIYANSRMNWLKATGLDEINMEFINPGVVEGSLGNYWPLEGLIHANEYKLRPVKNIYLLCREYFKPRNKTLFEYFVPYLRVIRDKEIISSLQRLEPLLTLPVGMCLPFGKKGVDFEWIPNLVQQERIKLNKYERHTTLKLTDEHYEKGKRILKKIGLPGNAWYITLHVREPGYRGETKYNTNSKIRNANPLNYAKSIKAVTEAGGWVFRMGNPEGNSTKLPPMPNVIDYAHSSIRSEFMDVFLGATCKFCIGTSSGYFCIPRYFSIPVILTNTPRTTEYFPLTKKDFFLPKIFLNEKTRKYIKFDESMTPPMSFSGVDEQYSSRSIKFIENQPDELEGVTKEMLERITIKSNNNDTESNIQKEFKKISEKSFNEKTGGSLKSFASIGRHFIERYSDLM